MKREQTLTALKLVGVVVLMLVVAVKAWSDGANETQKYRPRFEYATLKVDADSSFVLLRDSTFAESASKIIVGSLYDPAVMWDREAFQNATSGRRFPDAYEIRATSGQDSLLVWDREQAEEKYVFTQGANNIITASSITSVVFQDGRLIIGTSGSGVVIYDWYVDAALKYDTSGISEYNDVSDFSNRNAGKGWTLLNSSPAIVNATANAVAAIRDPEGSTDQFGRPKHIVAVGTANNLSVSDAGIDNFYDANLSGWIVRSVSLLPDGGLVAGITGTYHDLFWKYAVQSISGDSWAFDEQWDPISGVGSEDLAIANTWTGIISIFGGSVADGVSPIIVAPCTDGLVISHAKKDDNTNGLTFILNSNGNYPPYSSTVVDVWALEDSTGLFGKDLTASGAGVTYGAGVIGDAATGDGTDYLSRTGDADFNLGTGDWSLILWVKSSSATNPAASEYPLCLRDGTDTDIVELYFNTSGQLVAQTTDDGTNYDTITFAQDVYDANWHQVAYVRDGSTFRLYVDGEQVGTQTATNVDTAVDPSEIYLLAANAATSQFAGSVDQHAPIKGRALSALEIRLLYQRDLKAKESGVSQLLPADDVDYVDVDPRSGLAVAGNQDSLVIIDPKTATILDRRATSATTGKDAAILTYAGIDSFAVFDGGDTAVRWSQPDPQVVASGDASNKTQVIRALYQLKQVVADTSIRQNTLTVASADGDTGFTDVDASAGNFRVTGDVEVRGTVYRSASAALSGDIAEMLPVAPSNWASATLTVNPRKPVYLPPIAKRRGVIVTDDDGTRRYGVKVRKDLEFRHKRVIVSPVVRGQSGKAPTTKLTVTGVEAGDILYYGGSARDSLQVLVLAADSASATLDKEIPAGVEYAIYPPALTLRFSGSKLQPGDVVQITAGGVALSSVKGARGWVVATNPATLLNRRQRGVPVALLGVVPVLVDASVTPVAPGMPLTAGAKGMAVAASGTDAVLGYALQPASGIKRIKVLLE